MKNKKITKNIKKTVVKSNKLKISKKQPSKPSKKNPKAPKINAKKSTKKIQIKNLKSLKKIIKNPKKSKVINTKLTQNKIEKKLKTSAKDQLKKTSHTTKKNDSKLTSYPKLNSSIESKKNLEPFKTEISKKIETKKLSSTKNIKSENFSINSYVVYPSHGVGKIIDIETTVVMQQNISCYMIYFEKDKLTIKIPVQNADKFGIRPLASKQKMDEVFAILRSGVKKMKGMWSRRAQEYETKINSGDIIMLAEVIRDLTRDIEDSERSYSERIIYETAIYRLACEYSAIYNISLEDARQKVIITAKDKLESDSKQSHKSDDFDNFDKIKSKDNNFDDEEEDEEDEDEEEDDFNYEYNEDDDFDEDDDKPKKKKK
ncbi:MAG: hypothetical protein FJX30_01860 [Alphaproteobacteria bacterium]|nr:hypothetical protein [Alphaproteobacteria bacterium]